MSYEWFVSEAYEFEDFEWDERKNLRCQQERGFGFDFASRVFDGFHLEKLSNKVHDELRFEVIGNADQLVLFVVWTRRGHRCRIVSARRASKRERTRLDGYRQTFEGRHSAESREY